MSNQKIIPFGTYKDHPIEVLQKDKSYTEWLMSQSFFKDNYPDIHTIVINNFNIKTDDTPEHNNMQIKFLNEDYRLKLAYLIHNKRLFKFNSSFFPIYLKEILEPSNLTDEERKEIVNEISNYNNTNLLDFYKLIFENKGLDVSYRLSYGFKSKKTMFKGYYSEGFEKFLNEIWRAETSIEFNIELKPTVGDDYPSILRQMNNIGAKILVLKEYTGQGATLDEVKQFFKLSYVTVLLENEIDSIELPNYDKILEFDFDTLIEELKL